jgi:hypothetical protein
MGAESEHRMKRISTLLFLLGGAPLVLWPFVFMANVMQYSGGMGHLSRQTKAAFLSFVGSTTLYPFVFLCCVMLATYFVRPTNPRHTLILSLVPLFNLAVAIACFYWWFSVGK